MNKFKQTIPFHFALYTMITLLLLVTVFHILVLLEIIPYTIVWGGRLSSKAEMYQFEFTSITINLIMLLCFLLKGNFIRNKVPDTLLRTLITLQALLFLLNTLGNLVAVSIWERIIFAPLTLLACVFCLRIAMEKKST